jgi:hypothetical protein
MARARRLKTALDRSTIEPDGELDRELREIEQRLYAVDEGLSGNRSRRGMGEPMAPSVAQRLRVALEGVDGATYGPTATHRRSLQLAEQRFSELGAELRRLIDAELPALERRMVEAGVPWTTGAPVPGLPPAP